MTTGLSLLYRITILTVAVCIIFRYKRVDKASKIICWLIWLGLLTESIGYYAAKVYRNNYPVFNIAFFAEFTLMSLYFGYSNEVLRKKRIGIYIALSGIVLGLINTFSFQPLFTTLNSHLLFLECLVVMSLAALSFHHLLVADDVNMKLQRMPHFWFPCILLFYQCATLSTWGMYDKLGSSDAEKAASLDISILTINIITYLSYGAVFFFYPKMKVHYVQS